MKHTDSRSPKARGTFENPLLIYVAGPIRSDEPGGEEENIRKALRVGHAILERGHHPLIPHLDWFGIRGNWGWDKGVEIWEPDLVDLLRWDIDMLRRCDAIYVIDRSPGVDLEIQAAKQRGLRIITSVEDIVDCSRKEDVDEV